MNILDLIQQARRDFEMNAPAGREATHLILSMDFYAALRGWASAMPTRPAEGPYSNVVEYQGLIVLWTADKCVVCCASPILP